jgi:hypothetical protein
VFDDRRQYGSPVLPTVGVKVPNGEAVAGLAAGDEVIVRGIAAPQLHTLCEGSPLRVTEVRRP